MKVLLLTNGIWPYVIGGMQKHSYFLCKYLAKQKVEVILVHTNQQNDLDIDKLEYFTQEEKKYITPLVIPQPKVRYFPGHYVYKSYLYSKAVYHAIQGISGIDFVISKSTTAWYLFKKGNFLNAPVGINIHGYEFMQKKANLKSVMDSWILRWPFIYINKKSDYVFSYGGRISELIRKLGVPENKIIELPAGIECDWMVESIKPSVGKRKFVFVGRFERRKGIEELHSVLKLLVKQFDFVFHFIGPIPDDQKIKSTKVIYHGSVREKERLQSILNDSEILVCPSYAEGMPNVILEGMANGCAVIASDVGAVNEMVDDTVGWLVHAGDKNQLKEVLISCIGMENGNLEKIRRNALNKVKSNFTWDQVILKTIKEMEIRIS